MEAGRAGHVIKSIIIRLFDLVRCRWNGGLKLDGKEGLDRSAYCLLSGRADKRENLNVQYV